MKNTIEVVERLYFGKTIQDAWDDFTTTGDDDDNIIRINIEWLEKNWVVRVTCKS